MDDERYYIEMQADEIKLLKRVTTPTGELCPGCRALYQDGDPYVAHLPSCTHKAASLDVA
jgi:hypothetical protein